MSLFAKFAVIRAGIDALAASGRNPFDVRFEKILSATEAVLEGQPCLLFGTNNYLGLTFDASCIEASVRSVHEAGTGTTGSRIANGTYLDHALLEQGIVLFEALYRSFERTEPSAAGRRRKASRRGP